MISKYLIKNQTDFALSCETNTTITNGNDYNYEDEARFIQHPPSKGSDNVVYSDIIIEAKELARKVQNDKTMRKSILTPYNIGLVCFIMVNNLIYNLSHI